MSNPEMTDNFIITLNIVTKCWPFRWGPFGGRRALRFSCVSGEVSIHQRNVDEYREPLEVELYDGPKTLTTTVGYQGSARLKRHTFKKDNGK